MRAARPKPLDCIQLRSDVDLWADPAPTGPRGAVGTRHPNVVHVPSVGAVAPVDPEIEPEPKGVARIDEDIEIHLGLAPAARQRSAVGAREGPLCG